VEPPVLLRLIEETTLSTWLRESESPFVFYLVLLCHTFGLALLIGANGLLDLRLIGFLREIPVAPLRRLFRLMWLGLGVNLVTGVLLLISYPTKSLTNPVFYAKLTAIACAVRVLTKLHAVFADTSATDADLIARGATLARWSLGLWIATITGGRLLAYTYKYILYPS